jgi:hypothetical protein
LTPPNDRLYIPRVVRKGDSSLRAGIHRIVEKGKSYTSRHARGDVLFFVVVGVGILNRRLYAFFYRQRGLAFALAAFPLHLAYFLCSGVGFLARWLRLRLGDGLAGGTHG